MNITLVTLLILLSAATRRQPRFQATKSQACLIFFTAVPKLPFEFTNARQ